MPAPRCLVVLVVLLSVGACDSDAPSRAVDRGRSTGCAIDTRTIKSAQDAYFALHQSYAAEVDLVPDYLSAASPLHDVALVPGGGNYKLVVADARCGTVGHEVGQTPTDI